MNKKLRSLIIAGLLVVSMAGGVFAEGEDLPPTGTIEIDYPKFDGVTQRVFNELGGNIFLTLYKDTNTDENTGEVSSVYRAIIKWNPDAVNVTGVKMTYADGTTAYRDIMTSAPEDQDCYVAIQDGDQFKVNIQDNIEGELVKVEIMFENLPGPTTPKEEINVPETGDALLIVPGLALGAGVITLYLTGKNKDDEE